MKVNIVVGALVGACAALMAATGAAAQGASTNGPDRGGAGGNVHAPREIYGPAAMRTVASTPSRIDSSSREMNRGRPLLQRADPISNDPAVWMRSAQAALSGAGRSCQVTEAIVVGRDLEHKAVYEAACADGPGFVVVDRRHPIAVPCAELVSGQGRRDLDVDFVAVEQCRLRSNQPDLTHFAALAAEAGVTCRVDQAAEIGRSTYEIGCDGADGYWIEQTATGWTRTDCLKVVGQGGACRFTTAEEQGQTLSAKLGGSPAAGCSVSQAVYVGAAGSDHYYEARCGDGAGYMLRMGDDGALRQTFACEDAAHIGGGCQLTRTTPRS